MAMADINDTKHYAQWLLSKKNAHCDLEAPDGPYTCEECPWGAKTREAYHEISNDPSEAHYNCPVLGTEVWGEDPKCKPHQTALLERIVKEAADWEAFEREQDEAAAKERAEHERRESLRASGIAKLTDDERAALNIRL